MILKLNCRKSTTLADTEARVHAHIFIYIHTHAYTHTHIHTHTCIHWSARMRIYTHAHAHKEMAGFVIALRPQTPKHIDQYRSVGHEWGNPFLANQFVSTYTGWSTTHEETPALIHTHINSAGSVVRLMMEIPMADLERCLRSFLPVCNINLVL
jgi:hypothetical protein